MWYIRGVRPIRGVFMPPSVPTYLLMLLVSSGVLVVQCHQPLQCFRSGLRPSRFQLFISCRNGAHEQNGQRVIPTCPPLACCHVWGRRKPSNWVKVLCDDNRRANRTRNPPRCQGVVVPAPCQLDGSVHPDKSFFLGGRGGADSGWWT